MLVTEEQINRFHEDGAILLKNAFRENCFDCSKQQNMIDLITKGTTNGPKISFCGTNNQIIFKS